MVECTAVFCGRLIDGLGDEPLSDHVVLIEDERVIDVGPREDVDTDGVLVPTLAIVDRICEHGTDHGVPEFGLKKAREAREVHFDAVERCNEVGVTIALGTDFVGSDLVPHGENAEEAELYVEQCGMAPMAAIKAATSNAARTLRHAEVGAVEPGRFADLVVLDDDPLEDIGALRTSITAVYKGGERVQS